MVYFLLADDIAMLKKHIDLIKKKEFKNEEYQLLKSSLINDSNVSIVEELYTYSFFNVKRFFIINDANFVLTEKTLYYDDYSQKNIEDILNYSGNDIVIMTCVGKKNNHNEKKILEIKKKINFINIISPPIDEKRKMFLKKLNSHKIDFDYEAIDYLFACLNNDMSVFLNETKKIVKLNKKVTIDLVKNIVFKYISYDFYELTNLFLQKKINDFLMAYKNYLQLNDNCFSFLLGIIKNFSLTWDILFYKNINLSNIEIAKILGENQYRINILIKNNKYDLKTLKNIIFNFTQIYINCVEGKFDQKIIPEYELMKFFLVENVYLSLK